jgi:DNA helicase IV
VIRELGVGGYVNAAELAARYAGEPVDRAREDADEPRTFGHVLVDEAQDVSAMQWRMLARRCPSGSMTIVGDFGQASRPGTLATWDEVLRQLPRRVPPRHVTLTVNYRTPAEIMAVANRLLAAAAPHVAPARAVRESGVPPRFLTVPAQELVASAAREARAATRVEGTVAVVAPREWHAALVAELSDVGAVANSVEMLDAPVAVLSALDAKGLEFDHVIVVEPARLVAPDVFGLRLLFVTLTRATKRLVVLHAEPLPEALQPQPADVASLP